MEPINNSELTQIISSFEYIIADKNLIALYPQISELLESKTVYIVEDPENSKNMEVYSTILEAFLRADITRSSEILVIGGGATSDLGGFVASTILRGVSWSVIPSTLLSMVDAAIGGKVGINTNLGKNLIGNFHSPEKIYFYKPFLKTLPEIEFQSGLGEIVKYAFLDKEIFQLISTEMTVEELIGPCAKFKHEVVALDFKEKGARKILNLGHSFGHAFEKSLDISHGLAVLMGLKLIIDLYSPELMPKFEKVLMNLSLSIETRHCSFDEFWKYFLRDKKMTGAGTIDLIIPRDIGQVFIESKNTAVIKTELRNHEIYKSYFN